MVEVSFEHPDGREDTIRLNVEPDEVEEALRFMYPEATILSVDDTKVPRSPDHPDVAARRWKRHLDQVVSMCRDMLEKQDVDASEMDLKEIVETAAPYFGGDRKLVLRLFGRIKERLDQQSGEAPSG